MSLVNSSFVDVSSRTLSWTWWNLCSSSGSWMSLEKVKGEEVRYRQVHVWFWLSLFLCIWSVLHCQWSWNWFKEIKHFVARLGNLVLITLVDHDNDTEDFVSYVSVHLKEKNVSISSTMVKKKCWSCCFFWLEYMRWWTSCNDADCVTGIWFLASCFAFCCWSLLE